MEAEDGADFPNRRLVALGECLFLEPLSELFASPFESMVFTAKRRLSMPPHIVLKVGSRDNDERGANEAKQNPSKRRQTGSVEVLDHFHGRYCLVPKQTRIRI